MDCNKLCKLATLDEVIVLKPYIQTTETSGKLSILSIQLIAKINFSLIRSSLIQILLM